MNNDKNIYYSVTVDHILSIGGIITTKGIISWLRLRNSILFPKLESLSCQIWDYKKTSKVDKPAGRSIEEEVVSRAGAKRACSHQLANGVGYDLEITSFESFNSDGCNFIWLLGLVGFLHDMREVRLELLFVFEAGA